MQQGIPKQPAVQTAPVDPVKRKNVSDIITMHKKNTPSSADMNSPSPTAERCREETRRGEARQNYMKEGISDKRRDERR